MTSHPADDATPRPGRPTVSVCMATFRGAEHVVEQLRSILEQLGDDDEVVVVDDASPDETVAVIAGLRDPRIRVERFPRNAGYTVAFARALELARGEVLMLSDQDDVWLPGRVDVLLEALRRADIAAANCRHFGGEVSGLLRLRLRSEYTGHRVRNLAGILVGYRLHWGNAIAMTSGFRRLALPFPAGLTESHDQWLAMLGNVAGEIAYLDDDVTLHRLHGGNLTPRSARSPRLVAAARLRFLQQLLVAVRRVRRVRRPGRTGAGRGA